MDFLMLQPPIKINKNDSKYLSKIQIKKAQFLFENDYFIWNEAEMYLRYHEFFSNLPNSDILYENVCKTTRVVFNLIHDVHFSGIDSNAAHLKFYEVLDAWGALSLYLKEHDKFPKPFLDWFNSIFQIYQTNDEYGEKIASYECLHRLFLISGLDSKMATESYYLITSNNTLKLTFERLVHLLKYVVNTNDSQHFSNALVPRLQSYLLIDTPEKPPEQVLRNYDYEMNNLYSNLCDWKSQKGVEKTYDSKQVYDNNIRSYYQFFDQLKEKANADYKEYIYGSNYLKQEDSKQDSIDSKPNKEKYSSDYYSKTNISDLYSQYGVQNQNSMSAANSFTIYDSDKIYSNPNSIYDTTNIYTINSNSVTKQADKSQTDFDKQLNIEMALKESKELEQMISEKMNKYNSNSNRKVDLPSSKENKTQENENDKLNYKEAKILIQDTEYNESESLTKLNEEKKEFPANNKPQQSELYKAKKIVIKEKEIPKDNSRNVLNEFSISRLSGSASEINSRDSFKTVFKMSEFKKEFKRNDPYQNMSKSINTLDMFGKGQRSYLNESKNNNASMSHSDLRKGFSSSSSNIRHVSDESKSMSKLISKQLKLNKSKLLSKHKDIQFVKQGISDSLNSSDCDVENVSLKKSIFLNNNTQNTPPNVNNKPKFKRPSRYDSEAAIYSKANSELLSYSTKTNLSKKQLSDTNKSNINLKRSDTIRYDIRKEFKSPSIEDSDNSNLTNVSKTNKMLFHQQPKKQIFKKDTSLVLSSSSIFSSSGESEKNLVNKSEVLINVTAPNTESTVVPTELSKTSKIKPIQTNTTPSTLTPVTTNTPITTNSTTNSNTQNSSSTLSVSTNQAKQYVIDESTNDENKKSSELSNENDSNSNVNLPILKLNLDKIRSFQIDKEFKNRGKSNRTYDFKSKSSNTRSLIDDKILNKSHSWLTNLPSEAKNSKKNCGPISNSIAPNTKDLFLKRKKLSNKLYDYDDVETKSEKYFKIKANDPKVTRSYGLTSEPIKSIANAITLSSLDTLNDIDSEDEDEDEDSLNVDETQEDNFNDDDEDDDENDEDDDEDDENDEDEDDDDNDDDDYESNEVIRHLTKLNREKLIDSSFLDNQYYKFDNDYYASSLTSNNINNFNLHENNKMTFDQDWSYSQNSNTYTFSISDQKIISQVVKKLKPYIVKCVKKEVKNYFEKNPLNKLKSASTSQHKYDNSSLTKIGDF